MTEIAVENEQADRVQALSSAVPDEELVAMLVDRARNEKLQLTGAPASARPSAPAATFPLHSALLKPRGTVEAGTRSGRQWS